MTEEQKQYYIDRLCSICTKYQDCNKDCIMYSDVYERITMRCLEYNLDESKVDIIK